MCASAISIRISWPHSMAPPPYGQQVHDCILQDIISELEHTSDYKKRRNEIEAFNADQGVIRRGIALTPVKFGISFNTSFLNQAGALIHIYSDGSVHLNHGGTEMGQGLNIKNCPDCCP